MTARPRSIAGVSALSIDAAEPARLARFWQSLLGGEVRVDAEGDARLEVEGGGWPIDFLIVRDPKVGKVRIHLDVEAPDVDAAVAEAVELGATTADDVYDGGEWRVLRDPEGNEFCILPLGLEHP